jgi:hypothetical protein
MLLIALLATAAHGCELEYDLKDVVLGNGRVAPPFSPCTANYTVRVSVDTLVLRLPSTRSDALVTVNGTPMAAEEQLTSAMPLAYGRNTFSVQVGAGDVTFTSKKTYTIIVERERPSPAEAAKAARVAAGEPEQVRLALGSTADEMSISWITASPGSETLSYGLSKSALTQKAKGSSTVYKSACSGSRSPTYTYYSGYIHKVYIKGMLPDTVYYYALPGAPAGTVDSFRTMVAPTSKTLYPFAFGAVGDLGQTDDSKATLAHMQADPGKIYIVVRSQ